MAGTVFLVFADAPALMAKWTLRVAVVQAFALTATLMVALDMYAHKRVEDLGGVNFWGYRGSVAARRQPNEIRIVVVGGTRAFGWGQSGSALASQIRRLILLTIDRPGSVLRPVVVINLGRLGALPDSYPATLEHFAYLQPDVVCIYDDLGVRGPLPEEATSAVFALTGYAPALPLVLREKGMVWRLGDVKRGYGGVDSPPHSARPPLHRAAGSMLEAVAGGLGAADRIAARALVRRTGRPAPYADAMARAIDAAHRHARGVVVAVSPSDRAEQAENLEALTRRLRSEVGSAPWLRFVDLGAELQLRGDALRLDGWNYGGAGTTLAAERMTPAFLSLIDRK